MRLPQSPADAAILSTLLFPLLAAANTIDCHRVLVDKVPFDLSELGGPRSVMHSVDHGDGVSFTNTTYTIDLCNPLKPAKGKSGERCSVHTKLCAIERFISGDTDKFQAAFPIAGDLRDYGGKDLDAKWTLLRNLDSNDDSKKEGLLLQMHGGIHTLDGVKRPQKAVVEFICDSREGTEGLIDPEDKYDPSKKKREEERGDEDGDKKDGDSKEGDTISPSLEFVRYDTTGDIDVLRLKWRTKYACENVEKEPGETKAGWGFFTWFILIAFLSTATYLIFGSWLNYNRYGARGWDLLPHGDTIRDVPYLLKDWMRRVMSSVQGGGSRGGYAAV